MSKCLSLAGPVMWVIFLLFTSFREHEHNGCQGPCILLVCMGMHEWSSVPPAFADTSPSRKTSHMAGASFLTTTYGPLMNFSWWTSSPILPTLPYWIAHSSWRPMYSPSPHSCPMHPPHLYSCWMAKFKCGSSRKLFLTTDWVSCPPVYVCVYTINPHLSSVFCVPILALRNGENKCWTRQHGERNGKISKIPESDMGHNSWNRMIQ